MAFAAQLASVRGKDLLKRLPNWENSKNMSRWPGTSLADGIYLRRCFFAVKELQNTQTEQHALGVRHWEREKPITCNVTPCLVSLYFICGCRFTSDRCQGKSLSGSLGQATQLLSLRLPPASLFSSLFCSETLLLIALSIFLTPARLTVCAKIGIEVTSHRPLPTI